MLTAIVEEGERCRLGPTLMVAEHTRLLCLTVTDKTVVGMEEGWMGQGE